MFHIFATALIPPLNDAPPMFPLFDRARTYDGNFSTVFPVVLDTVRVLPPSAFAAAAHPAFASPAFF